MAQYTTRVCARSTRFRRLPRSYVRSARRSKANRRTKIATFVLFGILLMTCGWLSTIHAQTSQVSYAISALEKVRDNGEVERAEQLAIEAIALAQETGDSIDLGNAFRAHARALIQLNRNDDAKQVLERSIEILEPLGDSKSLGLTLHQMSRVFRYRADYAASLDWLRKAERVFIALEDEDGLQQVYNSFGVVYDFLGQLEQSLDWHRQALALARKLNDEDGIADGLYAIGEVHLVLGEHEDALRYFQDALEIDQSLGVVRSMAYSHNKVGRTHVALGNLELARTHLTEARDLFAASKTPRDTQWAVSNLAWLEFTEGRTDLARSMLEEVVKQSVEQGWPVLASRTRIKLADVELAAKRYDRALAHLDQSLEDSIAQNSLRDAIRIYEKQAEVLGASGQHAEAFQALRKGYEQEQELFDSLRTSVIAAMQGDAEFERQAIALELAQREQDVANLALEREQTLRLAGLVTLLGLFLLAFMFYSRRVAKRQSKNLSHEVAAKTKELQAQNKKLESAYQAVDRASLTDPLTGLNNRRFLERQIDADIAQSIRKHKATADGQEPHDADLVFFLIDLDHFKAINDREGHAAGDAVLFAFSRLLEMHFRKGDILVRWGGEEFLVVARFTDRRRAVDVAERLRDSVANHEFPIHDEKTLSATCSIGFAAFPLSLECPGVVSWQEVVELADQALYSVKQGSRNGWAGYFAAAPITPSRPFADWVPGALQRGELRSTSSFEKSNV